MSKTRSYLQRKAAERIPRPILDAAGRAVIKGIDAAVEGRWEAARARAAEAAGVTVDERVKAVARAFGRELTTVGAATGAAAAAPGFGTAAVASALVADLGWFAFRATDLIMTIGAVHGRTDTTPEERRAWVLSILAFGEQAADEFAALIGEASREVEIGGERVGALLAGVAGGDVATLDAIRRVNATMAAKVVAKYGSRRTVLSIGKLLPFGVGAVVGGSANWALTRAITAQSRRFFAHYHLLVTPPPPLPPAAPPPAPVRPPGSSPS